MSTSAKPLFIVVHRRYFDDFAAGRKTEEFRPYGMRGWTREGCAIGRPVIISAGYGKRHRLRGVISGFRTEPEPVANCPGWSDCYGPSGGLAACVAITLTPG